MALVTEKWSPIEESEDRARREFEVSGVTTTKAAIDAVAQQMGVFKGVGFPSDTTKKAEAPLATQPGFGLWNVRVEYAKTTGGDSTGDGDPLNEIPRIRWARSSLSEPTDIDVKDRNIRNAAGDRYTPKPVRTTTSRTFTIIKNMQTYPFALAEQFEECVNEQQWTVNNSDVTFKEFTVKCLSIMPEGEYRADAEVIPIAFTFELRGNQGHKPFHLHVVNQGRNGFYNNGGVKYGPITYRTNEGAYVQVSDDVLLTNFGTPVDLTLTVGDGYPPVANPDAVVGYEYDTVAPLPARIHIWDTVNTADFGQLPL